LTRITLLVAAFTLSVALQKSGYAQAAGNKPDTRYIVADDLCWKDVGFHGFAEDAS
jgi:hypothetical protein